MANKEALRKWVAALRSGEYEQGNNALQTKDNKYCCLGVLCRVAIANGVEVEVVSSSTADLRLRFDGNVGYLPESVSKWAFVKIDESNPMIADGIDAVEANDSMSMTFAQIADLVENYYELNEDDSG